jgi:hypothetical protein
LRLPSNATVTRLASASASTSSMSPSPSMSFLPVQIPSSYIGRTYHIDGRSRCRSARRKSQHWPRANIRGVLAEALLAILQSKATGRRPARQPCAALRESRSINILKDRGKHRIVTHLNIGHAQSLGHALSCLIVFGVATRGSVVVSSAKVLLRGICHLHLDPRVPHLAPPHAVRAKSDGSDPDLSMYGPLSHVLWCVGHTPRSRTDIEHRANDCAITLG